MSWISQTFLQLVLLSVIIVGQNVLAAGLPMATMLDEYHSARLELVAQALHAVHAFDMGAANEIQAELALALGVRQPRPGPGVLLHHNHETSKPLQVYVVTCVYTSLLRSIHRRISSSSRLTQRHHQSS